MQVIAYIGIAASLAGTVAAWRFVGQVDETVGESLELTTEALLALDQTIALADDVLGTVREALLVSEDTLADVGMSISASTEVLAGVTELADSVAPSVEAAAITIEEVAAIGRTVDDVLSQLDAVPFGPDYDPETPLGDQLSQLSEDIAPIAPALRDSSDRVGEFVGSTEAVERNLESFAEAIAMINEQLRTSDALLDQYEIAARRALVLTADARADLDRDVTTTRMLLVMIGAAIALGQIVPFWVGKELVLASGEPAGTATVETDSWGG